MSEPSPWPERERTQRRLAAAGGALLVPVALSLAGVLPLSDAAVVGAATIAAALLVYGLLGWAGNWVAETSGDGPASGAADDDVPEPPADDAPDPAGDGSED